MNQGVFKHEVIPRAFLLYEGSISNAGVRLARTWTTGLLCLSW